VSTFRRPLPRFNRRPLPSPPSPTNSDGLNRRLFLTRATALAASSLAFPYVSRAAVLGANSKLNIAGIGVGGKGWTDITSCDSQNIVGLCDTDSTRLANAHKKYPNAVAVADWRELLEKHGSKLDAVTVSTPDHTHFPASLAAIRLGKHVYCQKPLTHTVWEARSLAEAARRAKVATQMGNQGISHAALQREAEVLRAGAVGGIRELHLWTDRPGNFWRQGLHRPVAKAPPAHVAWNLWLGVAPERPYADGYHGFSWRGFWDFGTGALGDMGCHLFNLPSLLFPLVDPITVEADGVGATEESPPLAARVTWQFPAAKGRGPIKLIWYDGGRRPESELFGGKLTKDNGVLIIGDKDRLLTNYIGEGVFLSGARVEDFSSAPKLFPKHPDWDRCHYDEWIAACKGGPKPVSNFDVAGPVTETVLLGNVALRTGKKLKWDAKTLKTDDSAANALITKVYRPGWGV